MKQIIFSLLATSLLMVACDSKKKDGASEKKEAMSSATDNKAEKNRQTALASIMAINAHDADAVLKEATPDCMDLGDGTMPPTKGMESVKASLKAWFAAFPDVKGEDFEALSNADGSKIIVLATWSGTFKNDFMGMKATGKAYTKIKDGDILTFDENGKVTSHGYVQNSMTYMNAVGAVMPK